MSLPFFFVTEFNNNQIVLNEETSKHMINVLRMQKGEEILLTNGKGNKARATIIDDNRKKCTVQVSSIETVERKARNVAIGISLIKNPSRFEWFLEKATEIGVTEIIPLICDRTEKEKLRHDRLQHILISAMLQSKQCWLPQLHEATPFQKALELPFEKRYIAHCEETNKESFSTQSPGVSKPQLILIGPEGDFTPKEIDSAISNNFNPISLGTTRLRTETAGIVAATLFCIS